MGVVSLPDLRTVKRLLIIRLSSIGDVVHALPVSAALGEAFPNLEISWVVETMSADIVTGNPYLKDIIVAPRQNRKESGLGSAQVWREYGAFLADLRRRRFDVTLDLQGRAKSGIMAYATGAVYRFGWSQLREGSELLSKALPRRPESLHRVDWFLDAARAFGANPETVKFPLFIPDAARLKTQRLLRDSGVEPEKPYAVLNAATGNQVRRWGAERFAETVVQLSRKFDLPTVLIGSEKDAALNRKILGLAAKQAGTNAGAAIDLAGKTNLKELAALLDGCAVHICGDTGSAHIAAALGVPVIGLYGPTDPAHAGPYGQAENVLAHREICRPDCSGKQCSYGAGNDGRAMARCLAAIQTEDVLQKAEQAFQHGGTRRNRERN